MRHDVIAQSLMLAGLWRHAQCLCHVRSLPSPLLVSTVIYLETISSSFKSVLKLLSRKQIVETWSNCFVCHCLWLFRVTLLTARKPRAVGDCGQTFWSLSGFWGLSWETCFETTNLAVRTGLTSSENISTHATRMLGTNRRCLFLDVSWRTEFVVASCTYWSIKGKSNTGGNSSISQQIRQWRSSWKNTTNLSEMC